MIRGENQCGAVWQLVTIYCTYIGNWKLKNGKIKNGKIEKLKNWPMEKLKNWTIENWWI